MGKKKSILFDKYAEPTPSPAEKVELQNYCLILFQKKPTKRVVRDEDDDSDAAYQKKQKKVSQKQVKQVINVNEMESDMEIDSDKENVVNQIPSPVTSKAKKVTE